MASSGNNKLYDSHCLIMRSKKITPTIWRWNINVWCPQEPRTVTSL
jgi:hypothetical protein